MTFVEEVESGDRLRALMALRKKLAIAIEVVTDAAELSSLALRLQRVLEQIDDLGGAAAPEEADALAERRRAKLSAAGSS